MRNNISLAIIITLCCISLSACAQSKKASTIKTKKGSTKPELLVAINQKNMLPGRREAPPEYKFVIVWRDKNEHAAFFWKGMQTWEVCDITRAMNYNEKRMIMKQHRWEKELTRVTLWNYTPLKAASILFRRKYH